MKISKARAVVVPRYKELGLKSVWSYIKSIPEYAVYFPNLGSNELPQRDFMWNVLATVNPESTEKLIQDARNKRAVESDEDKNNLVHIAPDLMAEIEQVASQKVGYFSTKLQ